MRPLLIHRPAPPVFWVTALGVSVLMVAGALLLPGEATLARGALLIIAALAPLMAAIDWKEHRLPDRLVLPAAASCFLVLLATAAVEQQWTRFGIALLCALGLTLFFGVLYLTAPSHMGYGDVKLVLSLGLMLGWHGLFPVVFGILLGLLSGLLFGLVQLILRRATRKSHVALGPHLLIGALLVGFLVY